MRKILAASLSLVAGTILGSCGPPLAAGSPSDLQPASLGEPALAALVVGCWQLGWEADPGGVTAAGGEVPDSVRLRDEVVFGTRERLVSPATHPLGRQRTDTDVPWEARFVLNRWWIEDGSLRIRFSDGERQAWNAELGPDREAMVGEARFEEDGDEGLEAALEARRIECQF